jgi:FdhD protein
MTGPSTISSGITNLPVQKISADRRFDTHDPVVVEEPLEIVLEYGPAGKRTEQSVSVTMRTPGQDLELALGFLFTENIIPGDTSNLEPETIAARESTDTDSQNTIHIALNPRANPDLKKLQRHFYTSSSGGVCGKTSLDSL